jgi:hypothetical protein
MLILQIREADEGILKITKWHVKAIGAPFFVKIAVQQHTTIKQQKIYTFIIYMRKIVIIACLGINY